MNLLAPAGGYRIPDVCFQISQIRHTCAQVFDHITSICLRCVSPKQVIRPESHLETVRDVACKIRLNLGFRIWSVFNRCCSAKEGIQYTKILSVLSAGEQLKEPEKEALAHILSRAYIHRNYFAKFDYVVYATRNSQVSKQHCDLKDLFGLCDLQTFKCLIIKLMGLTKIKDINEFSALTSDQKLTISDVNLLIGITSFKEFLQKLKSNGVIVNNDLVSRVSQLEEVAAHPFFDQLKQLCLESRKAGMIFLGDYHTFEALNGNSFDSTTIVQRLFMGRICHIGIYVQPEGKPLHLSHVGRFPNLGHAIIPIKSPLTLPFSNPIALNIRSLIPTTLPEEQREAIVHAFNAEFQRLAMEEHPEFPLAEADRHLLMLIQGHKARVPKPLDKVEFPSKNTPLMCSAYVGFIFLKALQKLNKILERQGLQERIAHPFGEDENLMNMDILRLLYLWKRVKVIDLVPVDKRIVRLFSINDVISLKA